VFDTNILTQGNAQPQLFIETNAALRILAPNPAAADEQLSSLAALVTTDGNLLLANLKTSSLVNGSSGPVFRNGVASVAWSNKGKQMIAGLANGTCVQLDPQGQVKAEIPRPPQLEGNKYGTLLTLLIFAKSLLTAVSFLFIMARKQCILRRLYAQ